MAVAVCCWSSWLIWDDKRLAHQMSLSVCFRTDLTCWVSKSNCNGTAAVQIIKHKLTHAGYYVDDLCILNSCSSRRWMLWSRFLRCCSTKLSSWPFLPSQIASPFHHRWNKRVSVCCAVALQRLSDCFCVCTRKLHDHFCLESVLFSLFLPVIFFFKAY